MRWIIVNVGAIAMLGCGGSTKQTPDNRCVDWGSSGQVSTVDEKATHDALCARARVHAEAGCPPFDRMDPKLITGTCGAVTSFQMAGMDHCLVENDCATLTACFKTTRAADAPRPYRGPRRACQLPKDHDDLAMPAGFSSEEMAQSYGANAVTYADAPSTKDQPIEVCGFPAAGSWLSRMTCKDGSHPLPTRNDAERVRVGNVGEGGRCGRIIDQYQVECPEMTYDIFIDAYRGPL